MGASTDDLQFLLSFVQEMVEPEAPDVKVKKVKKDEKIVESDEI